MYSLTTDNEAIEVKESKHVLCCSYLEGCLDGKNWLMISAYFVVEEYIYIYIFLQTLFTNLTKYDKLLNALVFNAVLRQEPKISLYKDYNKLKSSFS